ncbi:winged helix-turn-helix domain-containing protein [Clostridium polynesiense]|uniref:winged helix-turn-helix domain-containing protein n=1 Tax=Clostridium polynesiense TaxID=1325933 RepID=UPI00058DD8B8|nr:crosslink repair DNA glycosylase YcaQ family protein [Clostridium polynesiense]
MVPLKLTKKQAVRFILLKQGLMGDYKYSNKEGILEFITQAGCIQYDPIDVCGKNAELVLQSRVYGFKKEMLQELLYTERKLVDYFDKNLAIIPVEAWIYFNRYRSYHKEKGRGIKEVNKVSASILSRLEAEGPLCSKDINMKDKVSWYWSDTRLSRAALETLYFRGDLVIHHKKGTVKYYDLADKYIPKEILEAEEPYPQDIEHIKWRILRRISSVGLLWNKPSDAWLNIWEMKSKERKEAFFQLIEEGKILEIDVEGLKDKLYCLSEDLSLLKNAIEKSEFKERTELLAPLDNMLWDRNLIKELFNFHYKWEIYTPAAERKYGYYVLPILHGENFIGRAEIILKKKESLLEIKNIWYEANVSLTSDLRENLHECFLRFMKFNYADKISYITNV